MSYLIHGYPLWQWLAIAALFMTAGALVTAYPVWRLAERAYKPTGRHAYHAPEPAAEPGLADSSELPEDWTQGWGKRVWDDVTGPLYNRKSGQPVMLDGSIPLWRGEEATPEPVPPPATLADPYLTRT